MQKILPTETRLYIYIDATFFLYSPKDIFSLLFRERGRVRERDTERNVHMREKHQLVVFSYHTNWVLNLQPRYVP